MKPHIFFEGIIDISVASAAKYNLTFDMIRSEFFLRSSLEYATENSSYKLRYKVEKTFIFHVKLIKPPTRTPVWVLTLS